MTGSLTEAELLDLQKKAIGLRSDVCKMICKAGSGHPGGSLSAVDIVTYLYFHHLKINPADPKWPQRDRFLLSKGHAAPILYAALAQAGFFDREILWTLRELGSILQGHPDMKQVPGVEMSTGALGHGLGIACGFTLASRLSGTNNRTYVLIGDGECQEGVVWEAAMFAAHYRLGSLTAIVDNNGLQIDGKVADVMGVEPLVEKWRSFGWDVADVDGHDIAALDKVFSPERDPEGKPLMVVARTVKGKGVSFMEHVVDFHGKAPSEEDLKMAEIELRDCYSELENSEIGKGKHDSYT